MSLASPSDDRGKGLGVLDEDDVGVEAELRMRRRGKIRVDVDWCNKFARHWARLQVRIEEGATPLQKATPTCEPVPVRRPFKAGRDGRELNGRFRNFGTLAKRSRRSPTFPRYDSLATMHSSSFCWKTVMG